MQFFSGQIAADLHITIYTLAGSVWCTAELGWLHEATTSSAKASVNEYEIAGCQADADAVMRYYLQ